MSEAPMASTVRRQALHVVGAPELEGSPYPKCSLFLRGMARLIDTGLAWSFFVVGHRVGMLAAFLLVLFSDGILGGQSLGKRICGIKAVHLPTRAPVRYRDSVLRNSPFALVILLGMMPYPLGLQAFVGGVLVIGGVEVWKVQRDPLGIRLGDVWAQTQVVDGKDVAGAGFVMTGHRAVVAAPGRFMSSAARVRRALGRESGRRVRCGSRSRTT